MIYIHMLLIEVVVILGLDLSGFVGELKAALARWLHIRGDFRLKPLDCNFCSVWWTLFVFLLCTRTLNIYTCACALGMAYLADVVREILVLLKDTIIRIINKLI